MLERTLGKRLQVPLQRLDDPKGAEAGGAADVPAAGLTNAVGSVGSPPGSPMAVTGLREPTRVSGVRRRFPTYGRDEDPVGNEDHGGSAETVPLHFEGPSAAGRQGAGARQHGRREAH